MRRQLSPVGQRAIDEIANRHGFSVDATLAMLDAVGNGNGRMAQFNHPEFAGSGQWMSGGMTMVSDLSDQRLKSRVDGLCSDLSQLLAREPGLLQGGSFQSQRQRARQQDEAGRSDAGPSTGIFESTAPGQSDRWWPAGLHSPSTSGAQNDMRYAWFADQRRLAIESGGKVTVYDTQDHRISGAAQQQSASGSLKLTSQHGTIDLESLPVVSPLPQDTAPPSPDAGSPPRQQQEQPRKPPPDPPAHDVYQAIEKLADLNARGVLDDAEFAAKKKELLARI